MEMKIDEYKDKGVPVPLLTTGGVVDREEFNRRLEEMLKRKRAPNAFLKSRSRYFTLVEQVKAAKTKLIKTPSDYRRAKRFDVIQTPDGERLIVALKPGQTEGPLLATMDEIYDIIRDCHLKLNHGGRNRIMRILKTKYKNVTAECVLLYLSLCKSCKKMRHVAKYAPSVSSTLCPVENDLEEDGDSMENSVCNPNASESSVSIPTPTQPLKQNHSTNNIKVYPELYSRGQVDIIAVTPAGKDDYKYMLIYRHYVTKFTHLRAIKTTGIDETVEHLLDIFLVFGAPNILQSKNGVALIKLICRRISVLRPDIVVLASDYNFSVKDFKGNSNEDILKRLNAWLTGKNNAKWQVGLKHVQHSLNTTFHSTLCRTPSEIIFGADPRKGIASIWPLDECRNLTTDDDLKVALVQTEKPETELVLSQESLLLPSHFIKVEDEMVEG